MAGRFAHALRTGQRGTPPRRARNIVLFAAALFAAALVLLSSHHLFDAPSRLTAAAERAATHVDSAAHSAAHSAPGKAPPAPPPPRATAKIVTCPACRLNALPKVKTFVYKHANSFAPALTVDFIAGEEPRLHLYSAGREVENIDLADYDTSKIMKKLYAFGIRPVSVTPAVAAALGPHPLLQQVAPKGGA